MSQPSAALRARSLHYLFEPRSVAVVGASDVPTKWGNWLARAALRGEHRRSVSLVNRRGGLVLGRQAHRSLLELERPVDLAVIAVPPPGLEPTVREALRAGVKAIVAITSLPVPGDPQLELALVGAARDAGAVLLGPNCLGVADLSAELELTSNPLPRGSIGLVSQSGNLGLELGLFAAEAGLGISRFASLGNQADVDAGDLVAALTEHEPTELIAVYCEDFRDGRRFVQLASQAHAAGKPVVLLAAERSEAIARAARSHTGALTSDGLAIDAACAAAGIHRAQTPRELVDVAQALLRARPAAGPRVGILADGGGHGAVAAGVVERTGLEVPEFSAPLAARLASVLPPTAACANPVDLAGGGEQDIFGFVRATHEIVDSGEVDAMVLTGFFGGYGQYDSGIGAREVDAGRELGRLHGCGNTPIVAQAMYPEAPAIKELRSEGVPVYRTIEQAAAAVATLWTSAEPRPIADLPEPAPAADATDYAAARRLLAGAGVPMIAARQVDSATDVLLAAEELGYPVVLKALGRLHKSDAGGVALALHDRVALQSALERVRNALAPPCYSVERMADLATGSELIIGSSWDERFGPVVLVGMGGVHAEVMADVAVALAPVEHAEAKWMLRRLRGWPLLAGARGNRPIDVEATGEAVVALSWLAAAHPELAEIEINPLLAGGDGVVGLDARLVARPARTPEEA